MAIDGGGDVERGGSFSIGGGGNGEVITITITTTIIYFPHSINVSK